MNKKQKKVFDKTYFYNSKLHFVCENEEVEKQLLSVCKMNNLPNNYVITRAYNKHRPSTLNMERNLAIDRLIMFYVITDEVDKLLNLVQYYWQEIDQAICCCNKFNKSEIKKELEKKSNLIGVKRKHIIDLLYRLSEFPDDFVCLLKNKYPEFPPTLIYDIVIQMNNIELYYAIKDYEMTLSNFSFSMNINTMNYYSKFVMAHTVIQKYNLIEYPEESKKMDIDQLKNRVIMGGDYYHIKEITEQYNPLEEFVLFELIYLKNENKGLQDLHLLFGEKNQNQNDEQIIYDILYDEILKTENKTLDKRIYWKMILTVEEYPLPRCHVFSPYDTFNRYLLSEEKLKKIYYS